MSGLSAESEALLEYMDNGNSVSPMMGSSEMREGWSIAEVLPTSPWLCRFRLHDWTLRHRRWSGDALEFDIDHCTRCGRQRDHR